MQTFKIGSSVFPFKSLDMGDLQTLEAALEQLPVSNAIRMKSSGGWEKFDAQIEYAREAIARNRPRQILSEDGVAFMLSVRGAPLLLALAARKGDGKRDGQLPPEMITEETILKAMTAAGVQTGLSDMATAAEAVMRASGFSRADPAGETGTGAA